MEKRKQHHRIILKEIHATPADGIYVTKKDAHQLVLLSTVFCIVLGILSIFHRKK